MANIVGTASADFLVGTAQDDVIDGLQSADTMSGGGGNDRYVVDNAGDIVSENAGQGTDTIEASVIYTLPDNVENLRLIGTATDGTGNSLANILEGNKAANTLLGGDNNDTLYGYTGNDTLDGGSGGDTMIGGTGDDTYFVDTWWETVSENLDEGYDTVRASVTYALSANVERLILTGTSDIGGSGNTLDNRITGNSGSNTLVGDAGNDILDGRGGADELIGGPGNDTYYVDNGGDEITEWGFDSGDRVYASVTYTLPILVENLTLLGSSSIDGTGNNLDNVITGNEGHNDLYGRDGSDTLDGGNGSDILDGGPGTDTLIGRLGYDIFVIDNVGDVIMDGGADDGVWSSISYTLGADLAELSLVGDLPIDGTGNDSDNNIDGNGAANTLSGGAGDDTLFGYGGADILQGQEDDDSLVGDDDGQVDTLIGGTGNDVYILLGVEDVVVEAVGEGNLDRVTVNFSYTLPAGIEVEEFNSFFSLLPGPALSLTGNEFDNTITGNSAENVIRGAGGTDILFGFAGADTFTWLRPSETGVTAAAADRIADFSFADGDRIDLSGIDADVYAAGNQQFTYIGTAPFSGTPGEIRYYQSGGNTYIELQTGTAVDIEGVIRLDGIHTPQASWFVL